MLCRLIDLNIFVDVLKAVPSESGRYHLVRSLTTNRADRVLMMPHHKRILVVDDARRMNLVEIEH